jgi:hypothetical protein
MAKVVTQASSLDAVLIQIQDSRRRSRYLSTFGPKILGQPSADLGHL